MPTMEFRCKKCETCYDTLVALDKTGKYKNVSCPNCKSKSKEKLISAPTFTFAQPEGTDVWNSDSQGHDYRYKHTGAPKAKAERAMAEALSHMGTDPYGGADMVTDDIEMDTGVHDAETRLGLS